MILSDTTFEKNIYISQNKAAYRKSLVSNVSYALDVVVPRGTEYFGAVTITFNVL